MVAWTVLATLTYRRARVLARRPPVPGHRAVTAYAAITVIFAVIGGLVVTL